MKSDYKEQKEATASPYCSPDGLDGERGEPLGFGDLQWGDNQSFIKSFILLDKSEFQDPRVPAKFQAASEYIVNGFILANQIVMKRIEEFSVTTIQQTYAVRSQSIMSYAS